MMGSRKGTLGQAELFFPAHYCASQAADFDGASLAAHDVESRLLVDSLSIHKQHQ